MQRVEVKKPVTIVLKPSVKKMAVKLAKKNKVSLSELLAACIVKINSEHAFIAECAELEGLTPLEVELKFRKDWGLE
jgi:hypothetical protein